MISRLMESFASEIKKEENQEYINNIISPYLSKYVYIIYLLVLVIIALISTNCFNTYLLCSIKQSLNK